MKTLSELFEMDWNFEQTAAGELVVVSPTGGTSGRKNRKLTGHLQLD